MLHPYVPTLALPDPRPSCRRTRQHLARRGPREYSWPQVDELLEARDRRGSRHGGGRRLLLAQRERHHHLLRRRDLLRPARHLWDDERARTDRHDLSHAASRCRSEEHTSELQSLMRISYAVFCLKKKKKQRNKNKT